MLSHEATKDGEVAEVRGGLNTKDTKSGTNKDIKVFVSSSWLFRANFAAFVVKSENFVA